MADDIKTKEMQQEIDAALEFLQSQLNKERKSMKLRMIAGIVICVIIFGYMFWLTRTLATMGSPEYIRESIVTVIKQQSPEMVEMAKRQILTSKKDIVDFLTKEGVDNLVAIMVSEGQEALEKLISRISNETIGELNEQFLAVLKKDDSRLRALLADPGKSQLEADIVKAFDDDLQEAMGDLQLDESFKEPLSTKHREAVKHLRAINEQLDELASKQSLSRRETLMVRFIKSWAGYMQQVGDDPDAAPNCNDGSKPEEGPPAECEPGTIPAAIDGKWLCVNPGTCQ